MQSHKPPQNSVIVSGFGSAVVDVLMMASQPIALQKKNLIEHQTIQIGGVIPTALVVLSRLGIATELHSLVACWTGNSYSKIRYENATVMRDHS